MGPQWRSHRPAVERAFRSLKTADLHLRPIHHWLAPRVRAHVFLCMPIPPSRLASAPRSPGRIDFAASELGEIPYHVIRELARACIFPGPRRSLLRLAVSFDHRAAHFDCQAAREGAS
jgi:hypothetical protein